MQSSTPPTIAAIILNYNYARFLPKAAESVLSQRMPFDELIIVDDGSSDESLAVMESYRSQFTLLSQKNSGQMTACLNAIRHAKSDYVYILDSDDFVSPDLVVEVKPFLLSLPSKLQFQLQIVDVDGHSKGSAIPGYTSDYGQQQILKDNNVIGFYICPPTAGNIYRKAVLDRLRLERFNPRESLDGTVALIMPYFGEIVTVLKPLAYYRVHASGYSQSLKNDEHVFQNEIDKFNARWMEAETLLGLRYEPFDRHIPFFIAERRLIIAAIRNKWFCFSEVADFVGGLWNTSYARRQKIVFTFWALALLLPISAFRKAVIGYRRAASRRPAWLSRAVRWINRNG